MRHKKWYWAARALVSGAASVWAGGSGWALDGSNDVAVAVPVENLTGWKTFEVLSAGDALGSVAVEGFQWTGRHGAWDGLGAYLHDPATLRVFLNHETGVGTISRVDLDVPTLKTWIAIGHPNNTNSNQVDPQGAVVRAVSRGWLTGPNSLRRPCSGNVWMGDTFGPGRGFAETLYLTGEEEAGGYFHVIDVATRQLFKCPALGQGRWENATIIDTGRTDTVALLLGDDGGTFVPTPLRLYVGLKMAGGDFLERNGLSDGTVYHWNPVGEGTDIHGLTNGMTLDGTWMEDPAGAARLFKLEDVHTDMNPTSPGFGTDTAIDCEGRAIYTMDFAGLDFEAGGLGAQRDTTIRTLFKAGTQAGGNSFSRMDNVVWSGDGNLYVNEDDGEGDIWMVDVASLRASYENLDFTPDASQVRNILDAAFVSETSGIIDISEHVGYEPGGVFLTTGQSATYQYNQMALLVSPSATPLSVHQVAYFAGSGGVVEGGATQLVATGAHAAMVTATPALGFRFVSWSDGVLTPRRFERDVAADFQATATFELGRSYDLWIAGYPSLTGADALVGADPDGDRVVNEKEFACNMDPTVFDWKILPGGTGTAGLPLIELRSLLLDRRMVVEYVRRVGVPELAYYPTYGPDFVSPWRLGGKERVIPIDGNFERVVSEDAWNVSAGRTGFALMVLDLATP